MMKDVIGVIFAESHYADVNELTAVRPLGALPINGRYRVIDFVLSNMVNSGIINVAVVTQNNYHSLMGHLGSGKNWGLARKRYGLVLFPPFSSLTSTGSDSRIDILYGLLDYLKGSSQEYVLLSESNIVFNHIFNDLYEYHLDNNADITIVYKKITDEEVIDSREAYLYTDENENVIGFENNENISGASKKYFGSLLVKKQVLINIIEQLKVRGKKGYLTNIIDGNINKLKIKAFELKGYSRKISSIASFYNANMEVLNEKVRKELFNSDYPIYTKDKDMAPAKYGADATIVNSFIADGCIIDGHVENSIIFRNVVIKKGASIKNCIILQQDEIGRNVRLENAILDKKVIVKDNVELVGSKNFKVIVKKGQIV